MVSVTFLESVRGRLRGASNYVKTNTFEQGLILTTLTHEMRFFLNFHAPLRDARHVSKGTRTRSILKPLTHFWLLGWFCATPHKEFAYSCVWILKSVVGLTHNVFVACLHHARESALCLCEMGLVVESGAVFYTALWVDFRWDFVQMLFRILKKRNPPWFWRVSKFIFELGTRQNHRKT